MQIAVLEGLSQRYRPLEPACTSGNCQYPDIVTLGVFSECEDITQQTKQSCVSIPIRLEIEPLNTMPLNCAYITENGLQFVAQAAATKYDELSDSTSFSRVSWTSITDIPDVPPILGIREPLVSFAAKYPHNTVYTAKDLTVPEEKPMMSHCAV